MTMGDLSELMLVPSMAYHLDKTMADYLDLTVVTMADQLELILMAILLGRWLVFLSAGGV